MLRRPVPWPDGAKVAVAITFDMDADSLVHVAHPRDSITRVSTISMLRYGPEVALSPPRTRSPREAHNPLGRIGRPEEIASAAVFLAGPGATFMTGQCISPNGGAAIF